MHSHSFLSCFHPISFYGLHPSLLHFISLFQSPTVSSCLRLCLQHLSSFPFLHLLLVLLRFHRHGVEEECCCLWQSLRHVIRSVAHDVQYISPSWGSIVYIGPFPPIVTASESDSWQAPGNFLTAGTSIVLVTWIRGIGQVSDNERMTRLSPQKSIFGPCPRFNPLHSGHISCMLAAATLN